MLATLATLALTPAAALHAQAIADGVTGVPPTGSGSRCVETTTRIAPGGLDGLRIRDVQVHPSGPEPLPGLPESFSRMRRTTLVSTIARQLLFSAGDVYDSTRVAETMRRLRQQRIFSDIALRVSRCAGSDAADLRLSTRDAWTLRPTLRLVSPATLSAALEDRDFLGTGRTVSVAHDESMNRRGASLTVADPWMFGGDVDGSLRVGRFGETHELRARVRSQERTVFAPTRVEALVSRQAWDLPRDDARAMRRVGAELLVGRLVHGSPAAATLLYAGALADSAVIVRSADETVLDTTVLRARRYRGGELGLVRQTASFDTVGWFAPVRGFLDVPIGVEMDVMLGAGRDRATGGAQGRYDLWTGRVWMPRRGMLLSADLWTSGHVGRDVGRDARREQVSRAAASAFGEATRGFWGARVVAERMVDLDADLRGASLLAASTDPTWPAIPEELRSADRTLAASAERAVHVRKVGPSTMLQAGVFAAASARWHTGLAGPDAMQVAVIGLRFRALTPNGGASSTRIDIGFPVAASRPVRGIVLGVSASPFFDIGRSREGRRQY